VTFVLAELAQQFADSGAKVVFCSDASLDRVLRSADSCPQLKTIVVVSTSHPPTPIQVHGHHDFPSSRIVDFATTVIQSQPDMLAEKRMRQSREVVVDEDILLLPYSSGTTGPPKGVMLTHKSFGTMMNIYNRSF